jgi:large subunit ribosomal protein L3
MSGFLAKKVGMTQVFSQQGAAVPVTVLQATPNVVVRRKTLTKDGYDAVQLGAIAIAEKRLSKPALGVFKKGKIAPQRHLREVRVPANSDLVPGTELKADIFAAGELVDVTGRSKGKGFSGQHKRHHFARGPVTHGSHNIKQPGSIGSSSDPSRVFKGVRMAGHMGDAQRTVRNLKVVAIDLERHLLLLEGAVPGAPNSMVLVRTARKQPKKAAGKK